MGAAFFASACATTRTPSRYSDHRGSSAYDEGFRRGRLSGGWAAYRDTGKPERRNFWRDEQYRRATEGYRPEYGDRNEYSEGFRKGYERGYRDRRTRERSGQ